MANWTGDEYAVMNLRTLKESIWAYASHAKDGGYSPIYEKMEAAQQALQELIDTIEAQAADELWERVTKLVEKDNDELSRLEVGAQIHVEHHVDESGYKVYVVYDEGDVDVKDAELKLSDVTATVERVFKELLDCYYKGYEDETKLNENE